MIALKTGSRDFVLLPEHKMGAIRLKETGFVVLYERHMYLLHESTDIGNRYKGASQSLCKPPN